MERNIAEIFSYSFSSLELWEAIQDMHGNQNNSARIFQIQQEIASFKQEGKSFVSILGKLKNLWNELEVYRPHTTDPIILKKRVEEDRVFQLLASLDSDYEEFRSHILMTTELPSLKNVCAAIQREEVHRKIMPKYDVLNTSNPHAYLTLNEEKKPYKGKRPNLKCDHCRGIGHTIDRCWILHPELKNKSSNDKKGSDQKHSFNSKAHVASHSAESFTSNPITLLNEFANFLHNKQSTDTSSEAEHSQDKPTSLLSKFASFLTDTNISNSEGILSTFITMLKINSTSNLWVVDSGAPDHITNNLINVCDYMPMSSFVSIANGQNVQIKGKGIIKLLPESIKSEVLYVPSFPFQLLSVHKIVETFNCEVLFTPSKVVFQDRITKNMIGEGFLFQGLYYVSPHPRIPRSIQALRSHQQFLWHQRLAHPSSLVFSKILSNMPMEAHGCETCISPELNHSNSSNAPSSDNILNNVAPLNPEQDVHPDQIYQELVPRRNPPRHRQQPKRMEDYVAYSDAQMVDSKPARPPLDSKQKPYSKGEVLKNPAHYQKLVAFKPG
ncbi:hypothetical protein ZIOFF_075393 [Zingiber officinale]|uniref:Retrovirus-related Pol polyprotein from transposon TNT 1-94-like beta-barrel domain-containing protein n=1 Tax=Zingiber officinale TaxID=94328 RepID=A0A8J5BTU4_ZINOF|nr:hypothetical protein ZIOFF_075393 [Zingiber officinale]